MPRGGPDASCLDRLLQTDRLEYLDRDDVDRTSVKRSVIRALEWTGEFFGNTEKFARIALDEVADVPDPKILELGSGHGGLSPQAARMAPHRRAHRDRRRDALRGRDRGRRTRRAPAGDGPGDGRHRDRRPDGHFDLAVFALSFHHLPPALASRGVRRGHPRGRQAA